LPASEAAMANTARQNETRIAKAPIFSMLLP
jgi:hypothetical protein